MFDPVRFLSNRSTGEMGYALAREALARGYIVTLISGPTALKPPRGVKFISIVSANDMKKACHKMFPKHDILIMSAAISDFTPKIVKENKIHRLRTAELHLKRTPDIIASLAKKKKDRTVIGFCLETENWVSNAKRKLKQKNLDGIVATFYDPKKCVPFGKNKMKGMLLDKYLKSKFYSNESKKELSQKILTWIEGFNKRGASI